MEFVSEQKYIRISPKKIRPILREIKRFSLRQILGTLPFVNKRGALVVEKVIKSAVANARQKGVEIENLKIKELIANAGPTLKRGRPVSRGMWHPIKKRTTHLKVVLSLKEDESKKEKELKETQKNADGLKKGSRAVAKGVVKDITGKKSIKSKNKVDTFSKKEVVKK